MFGFHLGWGRRFFSEGPEEPTGKKNTYEHTNHQFLWAVGKGQRSTWNHVKRFGNQRGSLSFWLRFRLEQYTWSATSARYFSGEKNKTKLTALYCRCSVTLIVVGERPRSLSDDNQKWDF